MADPYKDLIRKAKEANGDESISEAVADIGNALKDDPLNIPLLETRAVLNTKLQLFGQAINDYRMMLQVDPNNKQAAVQIEQLTTILRFNNTDIFENPNTTFDPWLE